MKRMLFILLLICPVLIKAQDSTNAAESIKVVTSYADYLADCKANPDNRLVNIKEAIPSVVLDIRYATKNNFMKRIMYPRAVAYARKPVADQLKKIQAELNKKGYGLKIFDGYRPYSITVAFYKGASNKAFVANPKSGSRHNRGCAIDLTLVDLKTGKDVEMPTPYDSFSPQAAPSFAALPAAIIRNRDFLISVMKKYGFHVISNEWWHYDFIGWKNYALMDIPFDKL